MEFTSPVITVAIIQEAIAACCKNYEVSPEAVGISSVRVIGPEEKCRVSEAYQLQSGEMCERVEYTHELHMRYVLANYVYANGRRVPQPGTSTWEAIFAVTTDGRIILWCD